MRKLLLFVLLLALTGGAWAYEEPRYEVVKQYENFELRRYAPQLVAETTVSGSFTAVGNQAFPLLADFIFGNNRKQEKISMTAPVNQTPAAGKENSEKIAMTIPVTQTPQPGSSNSYVFSFVMPSQYTLETLPQPVDPRIKIRQVPAKLMAVRIYSGTWSEERYRENERILLDALAAAGFKSVNVPVFARYNPPFSLWFLRRNEVLVEVEAADPIVPATAAP